MIAPVVSHLIVPFILNFEITNLDSITVLNVDGALKNKLKISY